MNPSPSLPPLRLTAWSTLSAYGHGSEPFRAGVLTRTHPDGPEDPSFGATSSFGAVSIPGQRVRLVPGFDPREVLGRKGTRTMDRVTGLAVATVGRLVRDEDRDGRTALVLGTTTGSAQSIMDLTRASLTGERPFDVEPATIPNSVMNCAAAQCAIWHRLEGPNATLACGHTSGLFALGYARRLLMAGRADAVICGAAEEYSHARAWLDQLARPMSGGVPEPSGSAGLTRTTAPSAIPIGSAVPSTTPTGPAVSNAIPIGSTVPGATSPGPAVSSTATSQTILGEGAAAVRLTLDPGPAEPVLATVLAVDSGYVAPEASVENAVRHLVRRALERAGIADPCEVWAALPSGLSPAERAALLDLFGAATVDRLPAPGELLGDTGAATAAFQVAVVLAAASEAPGRVVVLSCTDPDGAVAVAVLRLGREA